MFCDGTEPTTHSIFCRGHHRSQIGCIAIFMGHQFELQKLLGMKRMRFGKYRSIFKGCVWCSLPLAGGEAASK